MKDITKQLTELYGHINRYRACSFKDVKDGNELNYLLQQISCLLFYLETVRAFTHEQYQARMDELVSSGESVARSTVICDKEIPAMYQLRHIMDSGYTVCDAIRTNISYMKHEIEHSKNQ